MFRLAYSKRAAVALARMQRSLAVRIRDRMLEIADEPHAAHRNVRRLQGRDGYRLRVGGYRVLYEIHDDRLLVLVVFIAPRGQVYRR